MTQSDSVDLASRTYDAVLFDMDGTLIDSAPSADRCWRRWAAEFGLPHPENFEVRHGVPVTQTVPSLLPPERVAEGIARIIDLECTDVEGIRVLPGAQETLDALRGYPAAIVTSCTERLARARLAGSGLRPPSVVITADDVAAGKPDPEPFVRGAQALGVSPQRCLVVEDAPAGITAGRAAGCTVLALSTTYDAALLSDAHAVVSGLHEVRFAVGRLGTTLRMWSRKATTSSK